MTSTVSSTERVLVTGSTGGVGQLTVAKLLEKGFSVRVLTRNAQKAEKMFENQVEVVVGDICNPSSLSAATENISDIICCTGTTAFPSTKWDFNTLQQSTGQESWVEWLKIYFDAEYRRKNANNSPEQVDAQGVSNLVAAAPKTLKRFVFVSSCGVLRKDQFPYSLLNAFGVLDAKQKGEEAIIRSGLPYTIIRPGRLTDGPYTSYDLNTLLKATTGGKLGVEVGVGDKLTGQTSRIDVAAACVECLDIPETVGQIFELVNTGVKPENGVNWKLLLSKLS
ncbi:SDR family oxidoreductase [Limnoraphis robusta Tam1]|uniref:SDR family oxidoreductase n=1 Tax=Limnoraphis robusta TaxID=1118279 RepID=UPI002B2119B7|nr:SDR family oxidoreductase [Limnoraphis robusta]MEA5496862.1 SDR family oxidoreductase [Limnoraphis robusta BA-68 BA1]MEA5541290.1 SDR family oxidoreductase [Limnoraphis robusta Tam1]